MSTFENLYDGCSKLPSLRTIERDSDISPEAFFNEFIATRTPVLFNTSLTDPKWKANKWNHDYFRQKIPKEEILKIEYRSNTGETFGKGNEFKLSFHDFLTKLENKEENYYLTTQELEYDEEGHPYIMTAPIAYLTDDFPLIPQLFSNLILSNINLWYGLSSKPTTSGLHHDYHDNLYIILQGEKTITLYSPAEAENLYTVGKLARIHPNGRINYEGQLTFADGRDFKSDKAFQAALKLEEVSNRLAEKSQGKEKKLQKDKKTEADDESEDDDKEEEDNNGLNVRFNDSDDEIDAALDEVLDAEMDSDLGEEDDFDDENDYEDLDEDESEEDLEEEDLSNLKRKLTSQESNPKESKKAKKGPPDNFSQVNTSLSKKELSKAFPRFNDAQKRSITVTVKAGQMLYIPSGWFHEVRSQGKTGHMAVNYWFHPPDKKDFKQPYESPFWSKHWETRKNLPHRPL